MAEDNLAFPIPNSVLEPYIKSAVSAAIVGALGDGTKLIERAVQETLTRKVDSNLRPSNYSSDRQLIEVIASNRLQEMTQEVVKEMAEQMRPRLKTEIEKQIIGKHKKVAQVLVDSLIDSLKSSWNISVKLEVPKE